MPTPLDSASPSRRSLLALAALAALAPRMATAVAAGHPDARWYLAADEMRRLALSWGDQDYGAVVVLGDRLVGQGPSRVVRDGDGSAHAERVAIADAQRRLGRSDLAGAVLYATSRPCALCEQAAARAKVARIYFGSSLNDAGRPTAPTR